MRGQTSPVVSLWRGFFVAGALRWLLHERLNTSCSRNLTGAVAHQGGLSGRWRTSLRRRLRNRVCRNS